MDCQEIEELAGAIALNALSPEEMALVREHLASCEAHPHLAELRAVGHALLWMAPEMEPPPRLRDRLLAAARSEAPARPAPSLPWWSVASWLRAVTPYRLAAVLAVVVLALLGWNIYLQRSLASEDVSVFVISGERAHGQLIYLSRSRTAVMVIEGLQPLPAGMAYQVWAMRDGQPTSVGLFHVQEPGPVTAAMEMDIAGVRELAVTVEPEGGSASPTSPPVLRLQL